MRRIILLACVSAVGVTVGGCSGGAEAGADEANALEHHAKIVDILSPDATVEGTFDPKVRVYGYIVEAKSGAKITAKVEAFAGAGAEAQVGDALDTVLKVNGPYTSSQKPGAKIADSEDAEDGTQAAPPVSFTVGADGKYLISFLSYENTGTGKYKVSLNCEGTEFQCRRPDFAKPCTSTGGPLFIQGAKIEGDTTWDRCEVVLLENASVVQGATLTIKPGVVVKGNYLNPANDRPGFGVVSLNVEGKLQAAGTREHPIAFTAFKEGFGWAGISLYGQNNTIEHAVVEKANVGIAFAKAASGTVTDVLIEGATLQDVQSPIGFSAGEDADVTFERGVVKNAVEGMNLGNSLKVVIRDSVIKENAADGIVVTSRGAVADRCPSPAAPPAVYRDPIIEHTDIVDNEGSGIAIQGSGVFIQVSKSNIQRNKGIGVVISGAQVHPESFIRESNIFDNGASATTAALKYSAYGSVTSEVAVANVDVFSYHVTGPLDFSGNYWRDLSDPELSSNWRMGCAEPAAFVYTGFSPVVIADAGPHLEKLDPPVREQTEAAAAE